jgi:hypothetical protein
VAKQKQGAARPCRCASPFSIHTLERFIIMRLSIAAAAAAVVLAAPAIAQPDVPDQLATEIMLEGLERAHRNVPARVQDYVMTITFGPVRTEVYVHRDGDGWQVVGQDDAPLSDLFTGMVLWPSLAAEYRPGATAATSEAVRGARYLTSDTVGNQIAHVLKARVPGLRVETMDIPDSAYVLLDARTRQLLRVVAAGDLEPRPGGALVNGGRLTVEMTFGGHEAVSGVTVPRRMTMRLLMHANLTDAQRTALRDEIAPLLAPTDDRSQVNLQRRVLLEMVLRTVEGETMEIPAEVEDVRVNAGPPAWVSEQDE